jgi:hypothetical protein
MAALLVRQAGLVAVAEEAALAAQALLGRAIMAALVILIQTARAGAAVERAPLALLQQIPTNLLAMVVRVQRLQ